jgi:hypothetical protein
MTDSGAYRSVGGDSTDSCHQQDHALSSFRFESSKDELVAEYLRESAKQDRCPLG